MPAIVIAAQVVQLGLPLAQQIIDAVTLEMQLSGSGNAPTPEQQAVIDAGLKAAHEALQAAQPAPGDAA